MIFLGSTQTVFAQSAVSFLDAYDVHAYTESEQTEAGTMVSFLDAIPVENVPSDIMQEEPNIPKGSLIGVFSATAYDTYSGIKRTATGYDLTGKTQEQAKVIAVDPKVISLGTKVYLEFPSPYEKLNGVYLAADTGGAVKGKIIDVFWGDFGKGKHYPSIWQFGRRNGVKVYSTGE